MAPRDSFVFAHLADAHVGAWTRQPKLRTELRQAVLRSLARAAEEPVEFLLISGDLFHTPVPDPAEVAPVAAALRRLTESGSRIYAIYGSHDYVAHKTSWLDVLAEAGVFVRVAPESVRAEGTRWTLPYLVDPPTGAVIAGVSGRAHSLDREYFRGMDSEAFRAADGLRIFQFHAAVEEYLPESLRGKILGIRRDDLPADCAYYAGGHIHCPYRGEGPGGGLLVNPGAIYGTSTTDLDYQETYAGHRGLALVRVERGRPRLAFFDPCEGRRTSLVTADVSGRSPDEIREEILRAATAAPPRGNAAPTVIRLQGRLGDRSLADLGIAEILRDPRLEGRPVELVAGDLVHGVAGDVTPPSEGEVEREEFERLLAGPADEVWWEDPRDAERAMRELLRELGTERAEGESRADYVDARRRGAFSILGVPGPPEGEE